MSSKDLDEFYTVADIQKMIGCSRATAYKTVKAEDFPSVLIGKKYYVSKKHFESWYSERQRQRVSELNEIENKSKEKPLSESEEPETVQKPEPTQTETPRLNIPDLSGSFTINGKPQAKERPRHFSNGGESITYTPQNTKDYEEYVRLCYLSQVKNVFFNKGLCLSVKIKVYCPIPSNVKKWQIPLLKAGLIRPSVKPDWDNVGKIICDALNKYAYADDNQIISGTVEKYYSENPRVDVSIHTLPCITFDTKKADYEAMLLKSEEEKE